MLRQAVMCRRAAAQGDESPPSLSPTAVNKYTSIANALYLPMVFALTQALRKKLQNYKKSGLCLTASLAKTPNCTYTRVFLKRHFVEKNKAIAVRTPPGCI